MNLLSLILLLQVEERELELQKLDEQQRVLHREHEETLQGKDRDAPLGVGVEGSVRPHLSSS